MRDPELPNGFQDDDFEMRELQAAGRRATSARTRGLCDHGWRQTGLGAEANGIAVGLTQCLHCQKLAPTAILDAERAAIHG